MRMTHHSDTDSIPRSTDEMQENTVASCESNTNTAHGFSNVELLLYKSTKKQRVTIGTLIGTPYKNDTTLIQTGDEFEDPLASEVVSE